MERSKTTHSSRNNWRAKGERKVDLQERNDPLEIGSKESKVSLADRGKGNRMKVEE